MYSAETWTVQKVDQKYLARSVMWCWRRVDTSWTNCGRAAEVLRRFKEERNTLHTITQGKTNWIGHSLHTNCLLKHIIERRKREG